MVKKGKQKLAEVTWMNGKRKSRVEWTEGKKWEKLEWTEKAKPDALANARW